MLSETAVATEYMGVFVLIHVALGQALKTFGVCIRLNLTFLLIEVLEEKYT